MFLFQKSRFRRHSTSLVIRLCVHFQSRHLTIVLNAGADDVAHRLTERDAGQTDAIGGRAEDYHKTVNAAFLDFAAAEPERFVIINGAGSIEDVHERVLIATEPLLKAKA